MEPTADTSTRGLTHDRQRGAILIVALGVLTLLAVLGATFAQLMRLEKKAAENYVEAQHMDLLTNSAIDVVIATLHDFSNRRSWSAYANLPWLYLLNDEDDLAHGRASIEDDRVGWRPGERNQASKDVWAVYSEIAGKQFRVKTKVIDPASQINLNSRQDTLERMLDNLGLAIERSSRMRREKGRDGLRSPFYTGPRGSGSRVRGRDIMLLRQRLEGQRFQSKSQLRQLIGDENYEIVKDFVTCWSWEDPFTYAPADGINEVPTLGGPSGGGVGVGGSARGAPQAPAADFPRLFHEPRYPININTAPEEVLIACLQGLAGRRIFPYSQLGSGGGGMENIDARADIVGRRIPFGREEVRNVIPRAVFAYTQPLEYTHAQKIAQRIIAQRKDPRFAFRAWRTNDLSQPGFEDFIDQLDESFFPSPNSVVIIDPQWVQNRQYQARIVGGGASLIGRMWRKGTIQGGGRSSMRQKGLAVHDSTAWYYELCKGVLKANFNPNTRINRYNPNAPSYIPVDKSDLVWANQTRDLLRKGHTTEFCFDSMGIYEITTLGEMLDSSKMRVGRRTVVGDGTAELTTDVFPFRRKVRTVVKVFEVLRHTSQFHFEKTFQSGSRSSANDRRYTVTWPEPMSALTELYSAGSRRDGRVELAGLLDGQRDTIPVNSRSSFGGKHPQVHMECSFQTRSPESISRLRTALRTGGVSYFGDEVSNVLRDVLDADFVSGIGVSKRDYKKYYRRRDLLSLGAFAGTEATWYDPLVGREDVGTDLFPDGFNSNLLRMSNVGSRHVVYPARQRIGTPSTSGGQSNVKVGSTGEQTPVQNIRGNVPYYNGGIAFWVKFEFNGDDPVFSGLIGCTQVIRDVTVPADFRGSEGTQFFIFKNSEGNLRVVRMYYHQAFPDGGGEGGGDAIPQLYPITSDPGGAVASSENPITEFLDIQKIVSRSDLLVNIGHFRAHEWHHLAVDWNDQDTANPIRLFLDFQEVREGGRPYLPQSVDSLNAGKGESWVRLNERQPKEGLQVGGIVRQQGVPDAGVFKWYTNTQATSGRGGVTMVAPSIKRILANATIDELITYEGTFQAAKNYYGGRGQPGYFTNQMGEYANVFEVPLPPEVGQVTLRSIDWTSYYPAVFTDSLPNSQPLSLPVTPIRCEITIAGPQKPRESAEPWRQPTVDNFLAGKVVQRREIGIRGNNAEVVYKFRMAGSRSPIGNTAGGVVQTPAIDDVTLTYFLPSPKILLQEEAF